MFPGWRHHSFGYHGDNGKLYFGRGSRKGNTGIEQQERKHTYGAGDVVGCGYDSKYAYHRIFAVVTLL